MGHLLMGLTLIAGMSACDNAIYDYDEECPPEEEEPAPGPGGTVIVTPDEDVIRISVRVNPGSGGTSAVADDADAANSVSTTEGAYVSVIMEENGTYTLTATETNPEYKFVKWHDDTNDGDLTEGQMVVSGLVAVESVKYTAIFAKPDEPEPDPELGQYYVKFVFDMNMQFTDGFSQRVKSVDLYVFNNGNFVTKYHEDGLPLTDPDYLMELKDLPAGDYEFIAWCGLTNNAGHFTVPADAQISRNTHVVCTMDTKSDAVHSAYQNANLSPLFHGRKTDAKYVAKTTEKQIQTVYLTKNTNNVNITLQHRDGLEFDKSRFTVTMHDQNDVMHHDNAVRTSTSQTVQYRPYRTAIGTTTSKATSRSRADGSSTTGNFLQVEIATARLLTSNNPVITVVDNETGKTIFSIPLVKWATQLRSANTKTQVPDDQEYLDREDNYNLMLWMDTNEDGWFGAQININDWHVVDDSMSIK